MEELKLYVDGGARGNPGPAGAGVVIKTLQGKVILRAGYFLGRATNNVAEYTALLRGLQDVSRLSASRLTICSDSELMTRQLNGQYRVRSKNLLPLFEQAKQMLDKFDHWQINHIPRDENYDADMLANQAMDLEGDVTDSPSGAAEAGDKQPHAAKSGSPVTVLVTALQTPNAGACAAGITAGRRFEFSSVIPAGLCISAASVIIPGVVKLQDGTGPTREALTVQCPDVNCSAVFEMKIME